MALTIGQTKKLQLLRNHYEYAISHPLIIAFRKDMRDAYGFYDGDGQWDAKERAALIKREQVPVTMNKIKSAINSVSGREIQTRFRTAYRATSDDPQHELLAKAITHYGYGVQEKNKAPYFQSLKFRDMGICGIGWSQYLKDGEDIIYEHVNPNLITFDPDDLTPQLTNSNFVCRDWWMSLPAAQRRFKKHGNDFEAMASDFKDASPSIPAGWGELEERRSDRKCNYVSYGGQSARLRIVEVQHKESAAVYSAYDGQGRNFKTYDRDLAREIAVKKSDIEEDEGQRVMYGYYTGDILLEYDALEGQPVNTEDFSYIPIVYSRRFSDGVPEGIVRGAQDAQKEYNKRRSKLLDLLHKDTIITQGAFDGPDREILRNEAQKQVSVFFTPPGATLTREHNLDLAMGQFKMLEKSEQEIQQTMGIFDEALGNETNAQSGIAIQQRQINSVNNQIFAFDNLKMMKEREAEYLLGLIQSSRDPNRIVKIPNDNGEHEVLVLNQAGKDGKIYANDIASVPLSLVVEEVKDYQSGPQEAAENLMTLLQHPETHPFLADEQILSRLGVRDATALAAAFQKAMGGQQEQTQSPEQMAIN
jgi:hypothetical protein